jgi:ketosteroid isomerase-like protein
MSNQPGTSASVPSPTSSGSEPERAEDQFFAALVAADVDRLEQLLAEDFLIVDVMSGGVVDRTAFVAALRDRLLEFGRVDLIERQTRRYGDTAIIVGRTQMSGSFDAASFTATSRYTHVLLRKRDGRWRLASAQGTRIVDA